MVDGGYVPKALGDVFELYVDGALSSRLYGHDRVFEREQGRSCFDTSLVA